MSEIKTNEQEMNGKMDAPNGSVDNESTKTDTPNDEKDAKAPDDAVEPGQKCEIKSLEERYNKQGEVEVIEVGKHKKGSKGRFEDYALVTKQIFNRDNTLRTATLQVHSPYILQILREVVGTYPTQPAGFDVSITDEAPFALFFHHKAELTDYESPDDVIKQHHHVLLDWMDTEMGLVYREATKLMDSGFVTFRLLWAIFKPGELLYNCHQGHPRLYKLDTTAYKESATKGPMFEVNGSYVDYNGTAIGRVKQRFVMYERMHFTGSSPSKIVDMQVFPRIFVDDDDLEERLTVRGERLLELKGVLVMQYHGLLEYLKLPPYSWWGPVCERDGVWTPITIAGRVVVDKKTFKEDFAEETEAVEATEPAAADAQNAYLLSSASAAADADYTNPMLCPPFTIGYALDRKVWCRLFVDLLQPIQWQPNPMDDLILPDKQKTVLRALVGSHVFPSQARDEWGLKGKGLVILLHGTPGTGKTLTAETAAEYTKKALLKVSLSELKDDERLEENMLRFQRYSSTWKAIILVDEADVFLEARTSQGSGTADRNGLVAVFLRTLEYFQGIIFLTSNRVSVFDQAIKSRIHLALQYAAPSIASRRQMWRNQLTSLPSKSCEWINDVDIQNKDLEKVLDLVEKVEMNGREISNSIHTALTLARDEGGRLGMNHLETIIEVWKDFGAQLDGVERERKVESWV